ncbi:MAG: hypothetical protein J1F23_08260 [Oscillospiraceae bacterium]|nr:hypothetical protein [Oscillospiraceae bacterium]
MNETLLSQELQKMYEKYYNENSCKFQHECMEGLCDKRIKFCCDKVKLGEQYGKDPHMPKIVCVGLEGKYGKCENEVIKSISSPSDEVWNPHYKGVRYVLAYLLSSFANKEKPENSRKNTLIEYQDTISQYALTNCYKCAFGGPTKVRGLEHSKAMQRNCQEILFNEIDILQPDVLIIQIVNNKPTNFWENIITRYGGIERRIDDDKNTNNTSVYELKHTSGKPFLVVWTYHGTWLRFHGEEYRRQKLNPVLDATLEKLNEYGFKAD